jgi:hypothetical protein
MATQAQLVCPSRIAQLASHHHLLNQNVLNQPNGSPKVPYVYDNRVIWMQTISMQEEMLKNLGFAHQAMRSTHNKNANHWNCLGEPHHPGQPLLARQVDSPAELSFVSQLDVLLCSRAD